MNPNLPVGGSAIDLEQGAQNALPEGLTQLGLSLRSAAFTRLREGTTGLPNTAGVRLDTTFGVLALRHHFGDGWSADGRLPVGSLRLDPGNGDPKARLSSWGDLELGLRYDFLALWGTGGYAPSLTLRGALRFPSGEQRKIQIAGVPPSLVAIGTASFGVAGQLEYTQFLHKIVALRGSIGLSQPLTATENGLTFGRETNLGAGVSLLPWGKLITSAQLGLTHLDPSQEEGVGEVISSGGWWLGLELTAAHPISDRVMVGASGRVPLWQKVNGEQLIETWALTALVALSFGATEKESHDHEHDEGHEHQVDDAHDHDADPHHEADPHAHHQLEEAPGPSSQPSSQPALVLVPGMDNLAVGGASFSLETVATPGKVTLVDFWADWCAPCRDLEQRLIKLLGQHDFVVRRVEVPTFDSPVAREHLADVQALPTVWIYDPQGERVAELSGASPDDVITQLEALLQKP